MSEQSLQTQKSTQSLFIFSIYLNLLFHLSRLSQMHLKEWLLAIRILNILTAVSMVGFEIWYSAELVEGDDRFLTKVIRMFMPVFVGLLSITILTAEFKYEKVVEHFKFLQAVPGLVLFNLFLASLFVFQFSTLRNQVACILTALVFVIIAICLAVVNCLRPQSTQSLIAIYDD